VQKKEVQERKDRKKERNKKKSGKTPFWREVEKREKKRSDFMLRMDSERSSMIMVQLLCVDNGLIVAMQSALVVSFLFCMFG
jgi:hypothetical protein